jgi:dipeptidyl aminopeptidase/acylaminoacyl peptidase
MMPTSVLDYESLLRVPGVDPYIGFEISPDGKQAAFAWNRSGQWEIYVIELDPPGEPRQVTGGTGAKFGPRFSPDGRCLLYVLDLDGSEDFDVMLCDLGTGTHTNLTPESPDAIQPHLSWSPDGRQIALISNRSGQFSTYVLRLDFESGIRALGEPRLVFGGIGPNVDVHWSPDGGWLAVVVESQGQDFAAALVPVSEELTEYKPLEVEGKPLNVREPCWSPDGKRLAFSSNPSGDYDIGIFDLAGGRIEWATAGQGDKGEPDWSADGERLAYVHTEGPETWLAIRELDEREPRRYQIEPGLHFSPHFTPDGGRVLCVFDSPRRPDDLWQLDLETGQFQQLTCSLPANLALEDFVIPDHIHYQSLDGRSVPALLYLPASTGGAATVVKPPAVIVVHGGPDWAFQLLWYPLMAHIASRGWVVLAPNYRGSTTYGREWQYANRYELGWGDTGDVTAGADYLVRAGLVDARRIAITGRSHGGYLTMSCLTTYPDRWAGGSAVVPFLNWFTSHQNSREDLQHWDIENMGDPIENEERWRERSPFFFLDRIAAPVQLICGANDPRCPASESIAARDALLNSGKEVDFLLYHDEGHTFLKIENVVDHELRRVEFLARALE